jgi:PfaB family protein
MNGKIAIVGMEAILGSCQGLEEFNRNIYEGIQHPFNANLENIAIDVFYFKIPPHDIDRLDPQQLLMLKVVDRALKNANLKSNEKIAVIAISSEPNEVTENFVVDKIAKIWKFPCSYYRENSLVSTLQKAEMLMTTKEVDAVVVAGIDCERDINAATKSKSVAVKGASAIVLKPYQKTKGDRIYAVIDSFRELNLNDIGYLEIVGTETESEIQSLIKSTSYSPLNCAIASFNTNAGITSLIKTALCLYHRYIPATSNFLALGKLQETNINPFYIASESRPWFLNAGQSKRIAAINTLADDGSYEYLILSEVTQPKRNSNSLKHPSLYLFPLAGNNHTDLEIQLDLLQQKLENSNSLIQLANETFATFTLSHNPSYTLTIVAPDKEKLRSEISKAQKGLKQAFTTGKPWKSPLGSYFTPKPLGNEGKIAFVYPGAFNSYLGMGKNLFYYFPTLYDRCDSLSSRPGEFFRERQLYPRSLHQLSKRELEELETQLMETPLAMLETGTGFAVLFTHIMREYFKVQPHAAFGYSMGESTMMYALDVWSNTDYGSHFIHSSELFRTRLTGSQQTVLDYWGLPSNHASDRLWGNHVLMTSAAAVREHLKQVDRVYLTHINTPTEVVIAGDREQCRQVIDAIKCDYFPTPSNFVLHCSAMTSEYDEFLKLNSVPVSHQPDLTFYSSANYAPIPLDGNAIAHHLSQGVCQELNFPRLIDRVYEDGAKIFIELGSGGTCSRWIGETLKQKDHAAMCISRRGADDFASIIKVLAQLVSHQVSLDLSLLYSSSSTTPQKSLIKAISLKTDVGSRKRRDKVDKVDKVDKMRPSEDKEDKGDKVEDYMKVSPFPFPLSPFPQKNPQSPKFLLNETEILEATNGKISRVFGKEYEIVDSYPRRVRMPSPPFLFVNRVTKLEGKRGDYKSGFIQTEYDIPENPWYEIDGQIPIGICAEAGHGLLLLLSYLGADFESQGMRSFRLLDITATFFEEQPQDIKTLRYDVKITSHVKTTDSLLIFFTGECWVGDKLWMKLSSGCAGLFSDEELALGQGIVISDRDKQASHKNLNNPFQSLLSCQKTSFNKEDLLHLVRGNLAACFGDSYKQNGLNPSLRLPPEKLLMFERVIAIDLQGGVAGKGLIIASKSVELDDWYFLCHFKNDPTMPGNLMIEGGVQLLQFYMLFLGLQTLTKNACFQVIPNRPQVTRFRGQVTPTSGTLFYQLEITEIGIEPNPFVTANISVIFADKTIATIKNIGWQLSDSPISSKLETELFHSQSSRQEVNPLANSINRFKPILNASQEIDCPVDLATNGDRVLFNSEQLKALSLGLVSDCLGSEFQIYDNRRCVYIPNGEFCLISRVLEIEGKRHELQNISNITTEYNVEANAWFYRDNSYPYLPYCTYIEIAGQPCIFLGVYLGTTLLFPDEDLYFRNLDGWGTILKDIDVRGKTIRDRVRLISSTAIKGAILQKFEFQLFCDCEEFYRGEMVFGFFSDRVLANQVGLDSGKIVRPWYKENQLDYLPKININLKDSSVHQKFYQSPPHQPHYHLASGKLDLLDEILIVESGGNHQKGYIYATKNISPQDWYFPYHFYRDSVMPGALGIEAILQAMQVYALQLNLGKQFKSPRFAQVLNHQINWKYRGQITPENKKMFLEIHISQINHEADRVTVIGNASLWKENLRIYEIKDIAICLLES